jgi:hypothetical protein
MKIWYRAVCDTHKEACHIFVNNPLCTYDYLADHAQEIQDFLRAHYGCNLRLIHHDCDLEKLWEENYFVWDKAW